MTITEEEARAKWCPMVANVGTAPGFYDGPPPARCIASGCMAWRWGNTIDDERRGYCGLAGKP